ncbi:hypothetical protein J8F10_30460 [Gemmata sp. G18]|uniref:Uncharacterized protein n=1 Tax=Gemmata palustris TaxID=2822762 RepID=A0ABS5C0S8_9BACT|nr:hypothetical protein [Gemmata palustris]MBP3959589.1 hypothetical protein [Gemmata palustris]
MSQNQVPEENYSHPTTGGGLFLRVILIGAAILAVVVGGVWYASQK